MDRRRFLASAGTGLALGLTGCTGGDGTGASTTDETTPVTTSTVDTPTATATETAPPTETQTQTATPTATEAPEATTVAGEPRTATVEMVGAAFSPVRLSVDPPVTVEWPNRDPYAHNVKSAQFHDVATDWDYFSGNYGEGASASYTLRHPGIYEYFCTIHGTSTMCGVVLVGDVTLDEKLPCE